MRFIGPLIVATISLSTVGQAVHAELLIQVDKSTQRMIVMRDGEELYDWPVSSGARGYETPDGKFKPFRMEIDHYSDEYDNAPMPHSIFFTQTGVAIHGTYEQRNLGHAVSHGCVRLSLKNAATLWDLVKSEKMANTNVVLRGANRDRARPSVARFELQPQNANKPNEYGPPSQSVNHASDGRTLRLIPSFIFDQ